MQQASAGTAAALPGPLPQVIIQDGQILAGTLCKKTLGAAAGGLVHITWMEHGPEAARALLSQVRPLCRAGRAAWHSGAAPDARRGAPLHAWDVPCTTEPLPVHGAVCARADGPSLFPPLSAHRQPAPQIQFTVNQWLLQHGFSIGIGDLIADQVRRGGRACCVQSAAPGDECRSTSAAPCLLAIQQAPPSFPYTPPPPFPRSAPWRLSTTLWRRPRQT